MHHDRSDTHNPTRWTQSPPGSRGVFARWSGRVKRRPVRGMRGCGAGPGPRGKRPEKSEKVRFPPISSDFGRLGAIGRGRQVRGASTEGKVSLRMPHYRPSLNEFKAMAGKGNLVSIYRRLFSDQVTPVAAYRRLVK